MWLRVCGNKLLQTYRKGPFSVHFHVHVCIQAMMSAGGGGLACLCISSLLHCVPGWPVALFKPERGWGGLLEARSPLLLAPQSSFSPGSSSSSFFFFCAARRRQNMRFWISLHPSLLRSNPVFFHCSKQLCQRTGRISRAGAVRKWRTKAGSCSLIQLKMGGWGGGRGVSVQH